MRMRGPFGYPVLTQNQKLGIRRPNQWLPYREQMYWYRYAHLWLSFRFQPYRGLYPVASYKFVGSDLVTINVFPDLRSKVLKKFSVGVEQNSPLPPLSDESVVLKKFPRVCQFLTATSYDDGSPRAPGRVWIDNDGIGFTVTLMEPTAYARVRLRAATIDDTFRVMEAHLNAENAPWEVDQYARERAEQKKSKKK